MDWQRDRRSGLLLPKGTRPNAIGACGPAFFGAAAGGGGGGGSGSTTTWSPTDKTSGVTVSGGNLTATFNDFGNQAIRATAGRTSGKWYWEVTPTTIGVRNAQTRIGAKTASQALAVNGANTVQLAATGQVYQNTTQVAGDTTSDYFAGDVVMVAMDVDALKVWFGINGTWVFSGNPAAGTNQTVDLPNAGTWHAWALYDENLTCVMVLNCGATSFAYTPPSGFSAM